MFRKSLSRKIIVGLLLFLALSSFAQKPEGDSKRKLESWYHSLTFGYVSNTEVNGTELPADMSLSLDFLRFYLPIGNKLMIGAGIFGTGLRNETTGDQLNLYLYSASIQYYFNSIGDGLFLRGDVGMSRGVYVYSDGSTSTSDSGTGILLGAGYALPISSETSILFYAAYRKYDIEGDDCTDLSFNVGWLW